METETEVAATEDTIEEDAEEVEEELEEGNKVDWWNGGKLDWS